MLNPILKIKQDAPDFSFIIINKENNENPIDLLRWDSASQKLRSVGTVHTLLQMHELMSKSLEMICGKPDDEHPEAIYLSPDFPEFLLPKTDPAYKASPSVRKKIITWGNVRKEPGTVSGKPFTGTQEVKPRFREYIAIFGDSAKRWIISTADSSVAAENKLLGLIRTKAQCFDNYVQYNIWARSNYEVEELTEWFEEYMDNYIGMFREAGINQLLFNRQIRDDTVVQMRNGYHVRSVLYYVRTERVKINKITPISRINLDIVVSKIIDSTNTLDQQIYDSAIYEEIVDRWVTRNKLEEI